MKDVVQNTIVVTGNESELSIFAKAANDPELCLYHSGLLEPELVDAVVTFEEERVRYKFDTLGSGCDQCVLGLSLEWPTLSFMISSYDPNGGIVKWLQKGRVLDTKYWGEPLALKDCAAA